MDYYDMVKVVGASTGATMVIIGPLMAWLGARTAHRIDSDVEARLAKERERHGVALRLHESQLKEERIIYQGLWTSVLAVRAAVEAAQWGRIGFNRIVEGDERLEAAHSRLLELFSFMNQQLPFFSPPIARLSLELIAFCRRGLASTDSTSALLARVDFNLEISPEELSSFHGELYRRSEDLAESIRKRLTSEFSI